MLRSALQGWGDPTGSSVELPMPRVLVPLLQKGLLELATLPPHALAVLQAVVPEGSEQRVRASGFPVLAERGSQSKFLVKDVLKVSIEWLEFSSGITAPVCLAGAGCSWGCLRRAAEDRPCRWWSMAPHGGCNTRGEVRWPQPSAGSWQSKKKEKRYR